MTLLLNPHVRPGAYPDALRDVLSLDRARTARARLSGWHGIAPAPTPSWSLPGLAHALGLGALTLKDESRRSPLGSFKALGAPNALVKEILRRWPDRGWTGHSLFAGQHKAELAGWTVISATDGNHGRALAAAAASIGCRCEIVLHAEVSAEREAAIAAHGATIIRIRGDYDASVAEAARLAEAHGWQVISDTSWPGYEAVPGDVMEGYGVIVDELLALAPADGPCPWTHVILQGGVGGMAAGIAAPLWDRYGAQRPKLIVVEPAQADCLLQSALRGAPARATGSVDSVMAGLACGETSPLAWRVLQPAIDAFMTLDDDAAVQALRTLAEAPYGDVPLVIGESGVAGLAALQRLAGDAAGRAALGLDADARVLLIGTEGATAPALWDALAGRRAGDVHAAQAAWLAAHGPTEAALMQRLQDLAAIGATPEGGVCRLALTDADRDARAQLMAWMREAGLTVQVDAIGNLFGTRAGTGSVDGADAAPVMTGSHIDSVATGGRYDGSYGVMAGLEVLRWMDAHGIRTRRPITLAAFTNEEGVRWQPDMMGSLVHAGDLPLQQALDARDRDGLRLGDELRRIGADGALPVGTIRPSAYVELHIEQGPRLEAEGVTIGAVQDLQGIAWREVTIEGQSNHAGTTPLDLRRDAGLAAARLTVWLHALAERTGGGMVATVGQLALHPGLVNVVPGRATLTVDLRHTNAAVLDSALAELDAWLQALAAGHGQRIGCRALADSPPVRFDARLVELIEDRARARGLSVCRMTSGAGHDAQMIARIAPAAMIFVPSAAGLSHNPREHTAPAELAHGARVLADVLRTLADEG
jgi:N-carbamoyl-L-amino-acid hydrolase